MVTGPIPATNHIAGAEIPDHYIVVLNTDVTDPGAAAEALAQKHALEVGHVYRHSLKGFSAKIPAEAVDGVSRDPRVSLIEQDKIVQIFAQTIPTGIDRIDSDKNPTAKIDGIDERIDVDIAIIDTGIQLDHPDLNPIQDVTFVSGTSTGNDDNGHGTHVAGTAAALDNLIGVVGIAPGARLWAVKVLDKDGNGSLSGVIAGIDYVTGNAAEIEIANMSLGCGPYCSTSSGDAAINNAVAAGVTIVVAAGNKAMNANLFWPASNPNVITVSALADSDGRCGALGAPTSYGSDDRFATFSNFGSVVDLAAPGAEILSTYKGYGYATLSGTSMASPHVAGSAAVYKANNPVASPAAVKSALMEAGVPQSRACDTSLNDGNGGFSGDPDSSREPIVYDGVASADFSISASPSSLIVNAGGSEGSIMTLASLNGFAGTVSLTASPPTELTAALSPSSLAIASGGSGSSTLSIVVSSTAAGGTYQVTVTGISGSLSHSTVVTVTVPTVPSAPQSLTASAGNAQVALSWSAPASNGDSIITNYKIYRGSESGQEVLLATIGNLLTYTDTVVANGETYFYQVSAINSVGESPMSNEASATPSATTTTISVKSISYATQGGKNSNKNLLVTVALVDNLGAPISGASTSITLSRDLGGSWTGTSTTGTEGKATFKLVNAPPGCYSTRVNNVSAAGLTWDGITPSNAFCKT